MASSAARPHLAHGSAHVLFEEEGFVFKLIAGRTMYALRVAETGALEHLYWGPALPIDVDLRYLTRSNVAQPFDPTISAPQRPSRSKTAEDNAVLRMVEKEAREQTLYEVWRAHRGAADGEKSEKLVAELHSGSPSAVLPSGADPPLQTKASANSAEDRKRGSTFERRLENMAWRLLGMNKFCDAKLQLRAAAMLESEDVPLVRRPPAATATEASAAVGGSSGRGLSLLASPALSAVKTKESMAEPSPPRLDQLFASRPAPLRHKNKSFPANLSKSHRPPEAPWSPSTPPQRGAVTAAEGLTSGSSSIDMSALDLPLSDARLHAVAESHAAFPPCFIPGWDLSPALEPASPLQAAPDFGGLPSALPCPMGGLQQPSADAAERLGKNMTLSEISDSGTGDYRMPTFCVRYESDGSTISPLTYEKHRIVEGKEPLPKPMPEVREHKAPPPPLPPSKSVLGDTSPTGAPAAPAAPTAAPPPSPPACTTLVITMVDAHTGLRLEVHYSAMHHLDVVVRRVVVLNASAPAQRIKVERLMSATVDFDVPLHRYYLTQLSGSWARERHVQHHTLDQGTLSFGSLRGTSSHQHSPFLAISEGHAPPEEEHGHTYGFALVYSGSFLAEAEVVDVGRLRINMGLQPQGFAWHLEPGEAFSSPEVVLTFSAAGLGGLSRTFHSLVREHVVPPAWRHVPMPVLVNTWEAEYFAVTHDSVVAMARAAAKLDVEMIVLDDGWFGERHDATSSLGDWTHNPTKFPFGIRGLAREVNAEGVLLGLWIEPEMVSTNSKLYAQHPDWALHLPGRAMHEGRNQLVLDLSREEVRDHIFEQIACTLRGANIAYVKWDMNRHLTEAFSQALAPHRQGEVMHRYTMGVYALHERFVSAFPQIRFEACSGGGGRFDLGILYYCPQVWCSDNTDAQMRIKIQHGSSFLFPALSVGSHFSTVPNHITQGVTRKRTRALVAMCGTFGYELDMRQLPKADHAVYRRQVAAHKLISPIIREGDLYRLWNPFRVPYCAWMYVLGDDAKSAVVVAFNMSSTFWSNLVPRLLLRGLQANARYVVSEPLPNNRMQKTGTLEVVQTAAPVYQLGAERVCMHGAALMEVGIPLRFLTQDDSLVFLLNRIA